MEKAFNKNYSVRGKSPRGGASALTDGGWIAKGAGGLAAGLAAVNIFGGFLVTQRMLGMYKKKAK